KMGADPRQAEGQRRGGGRILDKELRERADQSDACSGKTRPVNNCAPAVRATEPDRQRREGEQRGDACESDRDDDHGAATFHLTPRPPPLLTALSEMSPPRAASSAATSFITDSTLPRTTPSLASIRWMVGNERPDNSASLR